MKLKFITLNIWDGGRLLANIIDFLNQENPDIVCLQEVNNLTDPQVELRYRSFQYLQKNTNLKHANFSAAAEVIWENELKTPYGNAILSKFPIKNSQIIFYDIPFQTIRDDRDPSQFPFDPRNLQHTEVEINNQILNIFNTQGIWAVDGEDNKARLSMSNIIIKNIKDKQNVILAGDFIVKPHTQTIKNIKKYLTNVFDSQLANTFNMKQKSNPGYASAVVDMIFTSSNIEIIDRSCPQVDVSDHLPLVVILDI